MPRGSKPGERRGGRAKGTPNKATVEVKELARQYAPAVLKEMARLATQAESESARVAAGNAILDRAYGKASQAITGEDGEAIKATLTILTGVPRANGD